MHCRDKCRQLLSQDSCRMLTASMENGSWSVWAADKVPSGRKRGFGSSPIPMLFPWNCRLCIPCRIAPKIQRHDRILWGQALIFPGEFRFLKGERREIKEVCSLPSPDMPSIKLSIFLFIQIFSFRFLCCFSCFYVPNYNNGKYSFKRPFLNEKYPFLCYYIKKRRFYMFYCWNPLRNRKKGRR